MPDSLALILQKPRILQLERRPIPPLKADEVTIRVKQTGLCGSDLHYYTHGQNGPFKVQEPLVLGHEASGEVVAVYNGNQSSNTSSAGLAIGDRVALEVGLPCRDCRLCSLGRYNICPKLVFRSSAKTYPHLDGTLQEYVNHPEAMCHRLPANVTYSQGALVEPLAVCLHAINRSCSAGSGSSTDPLVGSSALVLGAGSIGLLAAAALSVMGVRKVVIADIDESRVNAAMAMSSGLSNISGYHLADMSSPNAHASMDMARSTAETIKSQFEQLDGFSRVFDCTGASVCVQLAIFVAAPGGKIVLIGMGEPVQTLPISEAALREVDIIGVFRYANCYPAAINLFASGKLEGVAQIVITHKVPLVDGQEAFRVASHPGKETGGDQRPVRKVMVYS